MKFSSLLEQTVTEFLKSGCCVGYVQLEGCKSEGGKACISWSLKSSSRLCMDHVEALQLALSLFLKKTLQYPPYERAPFLSLAENINEWPRAPRLISIV